MSNGSSGLLKAYVFVCVKVKISLDNYNISFFSLCLLSVLSVSLCLCIGARVFVCVYLRVSVRSSSVYFPLAVHTVANILWWHKPVWCLCVFVWLFVLFCLFVLGGFCCFFLLFFLFFLFCRWWLHLAKYEFYFTIGSELLIMTMNKTDFCVSSPWKRSQRERVWESYWMIGQLAEVWSLKFTVHKTRQ